MLTCGTKQVREITLRREKRLSNHLLVVECVAYERASARENIGVRRSDIRKLKRCEGGRSSKRGIINRCNEDNHRREPMQVASLGHHRDGSFAGQ